MIRTDDPPASRIVPFACVHAHHTQAADDLHYMSAIEFAAFTDLAHFLLSKPLVLVCLNYVVTVRLHTRFCIAPSG